MHRRSVDRLTATLMYADRSRMSAIRRKVPLTSAFGPEDLDG